MAQPFTADSASDWQARIVKELKGKDYETLISQSSDGHEIQPFYTASDRPQVLGAGLKAPWRIRQEFEGSGKGVNTLIHEALMAGVDSISVQAEGLEDTLEDVKTEMIELEVGGEDFHPLWSEEVAANNLKPEQVIGGYAWDPLGGMLVQGEFAAAEMMPMIVPMIAAGASDWERWYALHLCGDVYHNAGATPVQELAYSLAQVAQYMSYSERLSGDMVLTLAAGTDYFETAAKLRAMRILWANLMQKHGRKDELRLFARSSTKDLAPVDQHGNLLRASAQAMAAIAGGAERITLHPFDGEGTSFSYRMARNIQNLLMHESYMDKNLDPMKGAYLFEEMTAEMAKAAWKHFKSIQAQGGWMAYAQSGTLQAEIKQSADTWASDINSGDRTWLGVNKYPDADQLTWKSISVAQRGLAIPYFTNELA